MSGAQTLANIAAKGAAAVPMVDPLGGASHVAPMIWRQGPKLDWVAGRTHAENKTRMMSFLYGDEGATKWGGGDIMQGEFALDPFRIVGKSVISMKPGTVLDFSASTGVIDAGTLHSPCIELGVDNLAGVGGVQLPGSILPLLAAAIQQDGRTITFSAPHGLSPGSKGQIHRTPTFSWIGSDIAGASREYYTAGEAFTVRAVTSDTTVEVEDAFLHSYPTGAATLIMRMIMSEISLFGGNITGRYEDAANNAVMRGYCLQNSTIQEVFMRDAEQAGISLRRCWDVTVKDFVFEDYNPVSIGTNYGLAILSSYRVTVENPQIRSRRHAITLTSGIYFGIPNREIRVTGGTLSGDAMAFDSHGHSEYYTVEGTTLMGGAVLGGDHSNLINCEIITGWTGDYTGVGVLYRERKGCNTRVAGCVIYTTGNPGGRYPVQLNIANADDSAFMAADQGGLTDIDVIIRSDFNASNGIRLGGGVKAGQNMVWKVRARVIEDISELDEVLRPRPSKSLVCYLDPRNNAGTHQLVDVELENMRLATSAYYAPVKTVVRRGYCSGSDADETGKFRGLSLNFADAAYKRSVEIHDFEVRLAQGAGIFIGASANTQDIDAKLYEVDSRDNSRDITTPVTAERCSIILNNIKKGLLVNCIVGDEQAETRQIRRISLINCADVELVNIKRVGATLSDDYTGSTLVRGRGFAQDSLIRTDTTNISSGVTTPASGAVTEFLTGTIGADRTYNLITTGAPGGYRRRIVRTGSGAFNWSIAGLTNLAVNQWCEVEFDYAAAAWKLTGKGSLT